MVVLMVVMMVGYWVGGLVASMVGLKVAPLVDVMVGLLDDWWAVSMAVLSVGRTVAVMVVTMAAL